MVIGILVGIAIGLVVGIIWATVKVGQGWLKAIEQAKTNGLLQDGPVRTAHSCGWRCWWSYWPPTYTCVYECGGGGGSGTQH